jgi:hypothetical protein
MTTGDRTQRVRIVTFTAENRLPGIVAFYPAMEGHGFRTVIDQTDCPVTGVAFFQPNADHVIVVIGIIEAVTNYQLYLAVGIFYLTGFIGFNSSQALAGRVNHFNR